MKSYIQGLITGGVLVFAIMILMGASDTNNEVGRYAISVSNLNGPIAETILDTKTGEVVGRFLPKTNLFKIDITDPSNPTKEISIHIGIKNYYSYGPCPKNGNCGSTPTAQPQQRYDADKSVAFKAQMLKKNVGLCPSRKTAKSGPNKKRQLK